MSQEIPQPSLASTVPGEPEAAKDTNNVPEPPAAVPEVPEPPVVVPEAPGAAPDEIESEVGDSASAAPERSGGRDPNYFKLLAFNIIHEAH